MRKPFDPVPGTVVPAEWSATFGRIAIHHCHLDIEINHAIWILMGAKTPEIGDAVTGTIRNASDRLELFLQLAKMNRPDSEHQRFIELHGHLTLANSDRNLIIHERFASGSTIRYIFQIQRSDPLGKNTRVYSVSLDTLTDLENRLYRLRLILQEAMTNDPKWLTSPFPSQDKSPTRVHERRSVEKNSRIQKARSARLKASRQKPQ